MAIKTYEFKIVFKLDDTVEYAVEQIAEMRSGILSGGVQRDILEGDGILDVKATLIELTK